MAARRTSGLSAGAEKFLKGALIAPQSRLIRRAAADRPPKNALRAMVREVEKTATATDMSAFVAELLAVIRGEAAAGPLKPIEIPAPTDDIETAVCAHFDRLEQRLPLATMLLVGGLGLGRPHRIEATYNTMRLAAALGRARGERKLELLRPFAWHVLENEYGPFLHVLVQADCAAANQRFPRQDTVGALVHLARTRRILPSHVWLEAGAVRNAAAHRGSWDYDVECKVIRISHSGHAPGRRNEYAAAALHARLVQLVAQSGSLLFVLSRAFKRDLLQTLAPAFIAFAATGDKGPAEAAYRPIEERLERTAAELRRLGWKQAP
jgi:hypothetical protein